MRNSRIKLLGDNWNFIACLLTISILAIYDSKYPAFIISFFLFLCFYLQIKNKDPFYLEGPIPKQSPLYIYSQKH